MKKKISARIAIAFFLALFFFGYQSASGEKLRVALPSSRPRRNPSIRSRIMEGEVPIINPIRGTFFACCASATGTVASKRVASNQRKALLFMLLVPCLSNHFVRPRHHVGWNREADLFRR